MEELARGERFQDYVREMLQEDPDLAQNVVDDPDILGELNNQYLTPAEERREQNNVAAADDDDDEEEGNNRGRRREKAIFDIASARDPENYQHQPEPEVVKSHVCDYKKIDGSNHQITWRNKPAPSPRGRPSSATQRRVNPSSVTIQMDSVTPLTVWKEQFNIRSVLRK